MFEIFSPSFAPVLCGRGGQSNHHVSLSIVCGNLCCTSQAMIVIIIKIFSPICLFYSPRSQAGNIFFRRLVRAKQEEYLKANKREKTVVAKDIVKLIRMLTPPGRFLKKDPNDENMYGMLQYKRFLLAVRQLRPTSV